MKLNIKILFNSLGLNHKNHCSAVTGHFAKYYVHMCLFAEAELCLMTQFVSMTEKAEEATPFQRKLLNIE